MPPSIAGLQTKDMLPGLHKVRSKLSGGRVAEYWYASRGGAQILKAVASSPAALVREVARLAPAAIEAYQSEVGERPDGRFLSGLIVRYLESGEYARLAPRTKSDYRTALDVARLELGTMEVKALEAKRARSMLISWRDKFKESPKTADSRLAALALVLAWAKDRGDLGANPLVDWPRIYKANRADAIWRPQDLTMLLPRIATQEARDAILFAANTALRVGDLVRVPWSAVGDHAIVWQTAKSRGRRTVIIPVTDELRAVLDRLPKPEVTGCTTVLTSSRGRPWTDEGLQTSMQRAKQAVASDIRKSDPDGTSPIAHLRFHDLRGTAATNFIRAGLSVDDVATILGWEKRKVEAIAARYVSSETIALAIVERMKRAKAKPSEATPARLRERISTRPVKRL